MRSAFPAILFALLLLAPLAAAQVPDPVATACATVGSAAPQVRDQIPLCPAQDPAPADPAAQQHVHNETVPPAVPQDPQALAGDAQQAAQGAAQDPSSAPSRLAGFVETTVAFVKGLLHLPGQASTAMLHGVVGAAQGVAGEAIRAKVSGLHAMAAVRAAVASGLSQLHALFASGHEAAPVPPVAKAPAVPKVDLKAPLDLRALVAQTTS